MEELRGRGRLVLVASPFHGHMTPMLQLGTILHSRGFSITIAHIKLNSPDPSHYPEDFHFLPLPSDNLSSNGFPGNLSQYLETLNKGCNPQFQDHLAQMIKQQEGPDDRVLGIIYDNLMYFVEQVAHSLKLPNIVLRSSSACYFPPFIATPQLHEKGYLPVKDSMLQELVPEHHPLRFKDLPHFNASIQEALNLSAIANRIRTPSAIIWNTVDHLEHSSLSQIQQHYKVPIFSVGPLHIMAPETSTIFLQEDTSCIPWLDKQAPNSVIYVSLGSLATTNEKECIETAWGLANSGQPFLWVIRPGSIHGSEWIEFLPDTFMEKIREQGCIVKWAPQREVLAHNAIGGFWTHCGWNSILESISEGVPMICRPYIVDQGVNARYVSYVWKLGLELEHMERGEIEQAIRGLLVDKEGEEIRQKAKDMKEKVKIAVGKGGSSYNFLNDLVEFILSY